MSQLHRTVLLAFVVAAAACVDPGPEGGVPGLDAPVEVFRDPLGIVHLFGRTDRDVMFASGYMQAHDRLVEMDLRRRQARGRLAEVLGPSALSDDALLRLVDIAGWGRANAELLREEAPEAYALVEAWTAGVNRRVDEVRDGEVPLPIGFGPDALDVLPERWEVSDGMAVGKLIIFGNDNQLEYDLLASLFGELMPDLDPALLIVPYREAFILPPEDRPRDGREHRPPPSDAAAPAPPDGAERLLGLLQRLRPIRPGSSNNFAVDGRHTATGRPLIAGDPHQPLESPSLFWAQHMSAEEGALDVAGFSFVGTPAIELGLNRHVAWTATTGSPDTSDLWAVRVEGGEVWIGGSPVAIETRTETIEVRGGEPVDVVLERVPGHGVLLPEDLSPFPIGGPDRRLLFDWTGFRPTHEGIAFLGFDTASSTEDFEEAVGLLENGNFNWIAADADGIVYRSHVLVPDRGAPAASRAAWAALDGDDPETFWPEGRFLGDELLPWSRAEARGWLASSNNDPYSFTSDGGFEGDPFYFGAFFDPGSRAARIYAELERLVERGEVTVEDLRTLQLDTHSLYADDLLPVLEEAWAAVETDEDLASFRGRPELETLVELLSGWDRQMRRDSAAALAFEVLLWHSALVAVGDDLGFLFEPLASSSAVHVLKIACQAIAAATPEAAALVQRGPRWTVLRALEVTAEILEERYGGVDPSLYSWGEFHGTAFRSPVGGPLDGGWVPTDGAEGTVNPSGARFFDGTAPVDRLESHAGPIYRLVATFDEDGSPRAVVCFPRGNSGDPESPYWDNTLEDWVEGRYEPLLFRRDEVVEASDLELTLAP